MGLEVAFPALFRPCSPRTLAQIGVFAELGRLLARIQILHPNTQPKIFSPQSPNFKTSPYPSAAQPHSLRLTFLLLARAHPLTNLCATAGFVVFLSFLRLGEDFLGSAGAPVDPRSKVCARKLACSLRSFFWCTRPWFVHGLYW